MDGRGPWVGILTLYLLYTWLACRPLLGIPQNRPTPIRTELIAMYNSNLLWICKRSHQKMQCFLWMWTQLQLNAAWQLFMRSMLFVHTSVPVQSIIIMYPATSMTWPLVRCRHPAGRTCIVSNTLEDVHVLCWHQRNTWLESLLLPFRRYNAACGACIHLQSRSTSWCLSTILVTQEYSVKVTHVNENTLNDDWLQRRPRMIASSKSTANVLRLSMLRIPWMMTHCNAYGEWPAQPNL